MEIKDYIKEVSWRKTNYIQPHEYTVREWRPELDNDFASLVLFIREKGKDILFNEKKYRKLIIDDYEYWTMGNPIEETTVINRKLK